MRKHVSSCVLVEIDIEVLSEVSKQELGIVNEHDQVYVNRKHYLVVKH